MVCVVGCVCLLCVNCSSCALSDIRCALRVACCLSCIDDCGVSVGSWCVVSCLLCLCVVSLWFLVVCYWLCGVRCVMFVV